MTTTTSTSHRSSSDGPSLAVRRPELTVAQRDGRVRIRCSTRDDGDFHRTAVPMAELEARRRAFVDRPWTMLAEHHGVGVREVVVPGDGDGDHGDIAVSGVTGAVLGCWVGDCAPVVLVGAHRRVASVHAGWRGLAAGVLAVAADAVGEPVSNVVLGPTIGPCCYEFGAADLVAVAAGVGAPVRALTASTRTGGRALDVTAAVGWFAAGIGAELVVLGGCTGCTFPGFSHRVRRDPERHVVACWREAA